MPAPAPSDRDLSILRSFASRIDPSDAGAHNNLGVLYYQRGLVPEAVAAFARALALDPKMEIARANLDRAYRESGFYDARITELQERLRRHPDDREARWELGRAYASVDQPDRAAEAFEELLRLKPDDVPAQIQLGLAEKTRGRMETAGEWFARAAELDPGSAVARYYLGEVLYNRGLNEAALEALQGAISRNPDYAEAHYLLAFVYGDMGRHEDARDATRRAIALNPALARAQANLSLDRLWSDGERVAVPRRDSRSVPAERDPLAHYQLGLAFRQKGYYAEALREYRMALDAGEDRRLALQAMAEVHLLRRDHSTALELYDELIRSYPKEPKLRNEQGVCLHQAGRRDAAAKAYEDALALDSAYAMAWNNLGVLRSSAAAPEPAIQAFRTALDRQPTLHAARLNLALLHYQRRQLQSALEGFRAVLAADNTNASGWNGVGLVLMELRRLADARNAFARAVEADPEFAGAHYNLSFVLGQLGDFEGALRETKRALELESYYVPQKYALTIDLQYEDPTIAIAPEVSTDAGVEELRQELTLDARLLDRLFDELAPPEPPVARTAEDPLALARDYLGKGLLEQALAEMTRARSRGANPVAAISLMGDLFGRRGLHGEALERYREARALEPDDRHATLGELSALLALDRAGEGGALADELARRFPRDVDVLFAAARARLGVDDARGALDLLRRAQTLAPGRADLLHLQAKVAARLGDSTAAIEACRAALELDGSLVQVWLDLGRLEEARQGWTAARDAYAKALDLLPTYADAAIALAELLRKRGDLRNAVTVLADLLATDPYAIEALTLLGRVLLELGRVDEAGEALSRGLRFNPDHPGALFHLGEALALRRRFSDAIQVWDRVAQVDAAGVWGAQARIRGRSARDLAHILTTVG